MDKNTEIQIDSSSVEPLSSNECPRCERRFRPGARFCPFDGETLRNIQEVHADPLVGCVVDQRYRVLSVLGEGGMGSVYRVVHRSLEREFALKALRGDLASEPNLAERFLREARSAAAITHPNVCEITDFGYLPDGRPYFAMELLSGKPLSWWLKKGGPMPVAPAVRMIEQIASVLELAHLTGIVHRDLKPENIVVADATGDPTVKVVDFGLAQVAGQSRLTRPGVVYGTPHYMSPEQASGGQVDRRADIYALGVVMYEMFTGRVPFEADTYMGVLTKHMYMAPTPPSSVVGSTKGLGAIEDVVLRCLQKRPERRYQRMVDLAAALRAIVKVGQDGSVKVRPRRPERDNTLKLPGLADELEPPTTAELQRDLARLERSGSSGNTWVWIAALASLIIAGGAFYYSRLPAVPEVDEPASAAPVPGSVVQGTARPARVPLSVIRPDQAVIAELESEEPAQMPAAPAKPVRSAGTPPEIQEDSPEEMEETEKTPSKLDFGTGGIVDPWSD